MKNLKVTVNGKAYNVTVEELDNGAVATAPAQTSAPAAPTAPAEQTSGEGEAVCAPMNGNILDIKVSVGQKVNEGDVLVVLEAMKMENEIMAPKSGEITSIGVQKGETVDTGKQLVFIK